MINYISIINLETRKDILGHPVKVNVLDVLRNVKLAIYRRNYTNLKGT